MAGSWWGKSERRAATLRQRHQRHAQPTRRPQGLLLDAQQIMQSFGQGRRGHLFLDVSLGLRLGIRSGISHEHILRQDGSYGADHADRDASMRAAVSGQAKRCSRDRSGDSAHVLTDGASGADAPPKSAISASEQRRPSRHASLDYWHFPRTNSVVEMGPLLHRPSAPINRRDSPHLGVPAAKR